MKQTSAEYGSRQAKGVSEQNLSQQIVAFPNILAIWCNRQLPLKMKLYIVCYSCFTMGYIAKFITYYMVSWYDHRAVLSWPRHAGG